MMPLHQERLDVSVSESDVAVSHTHWPAKHLIIFSVLVRSLPSTT